MTAISPDLIAVQLKEITQADPLELLRQAHRLHRDRLIAAVSFGAEDMVLVELVRQLKEETGEQIRLFTIDTGRLPEETFQLLERVRLTFKLNIEVFSPQPGAVHQLVTTRGPFSFFESVQARRDCCETRKVEPLSRALSRADVWVTGLRREQSPTRDQLEIVEVDAAHMPRLHRRLVKLSPLANWSENDVWRFIKDHKVPTHQLHEAGYPSVGCAPCTRAVAGWQRDQAHGVDVRSGRWWWENPEHKECGLHALPVIQSSSADPEAPVEDSHAA